MQSTKKLVIKPFFNDYKRIQNDVPIIHTQEVRGSSPFAPTIDKDPH